MSVYSLTPHAEEQIAGAIEHCLGVLLHLQRPEGRIGALLTIKAAGEKLEATVDISNTTNSMTLQADDMANAQHLADFIEAIANGTLDTAESSPTPTVKGSLTVASADMVNHPPHYTGHPSGVECIEVAEHLPFCLGNAFKYLFRRNDKGTLRQNLEKALWYIRRERAYRADSTAVYMLSDEAMGPLAEIIDHEPAPYSHIMELVGRGIMLDLAERMLVDVVAGMPE